jgi:hypothetical protein
MHVKVNNFFLTLLKLALFLNLLYSSNPAAGSQFSGSLITELGILTNLGGVSLGTFSDFTIYAFGGGQ